MTVEKTGTADMACGVGRGEGVIFLRWLYACGRVYGCVHENWAIAEISDYVRSACCV